MNRKEYNLLVEGWRNFLNENEGPEVKVPESKENVLKLAQQSQLFNQKKKKGSIGLHVTFAIGEGGKPVSSNKLTCSDLKGGKLEGLKGKLVKSTYGYVGIDLDDASKSELNKKYGDFIPKVGSQGKEIVMSQVVKNSKGDYKLPHHVTFGMGDIRKLKLKDSEGKNARYDLSSFAKQGQEFTLTAEGVCCEEVEGVMICAVKIGF